MSLTAAVWVATLAALVFAGSALAYTSRAQVNCGDAEAAHAEWLLDQPGHYSLYVGRRIDGQVRQDSGGSIDCADAQGCVWPVLVPGLAGEEIRYLLVKGTGSSLALEWGCVTASGASA